MNRENSSIIVTEDLKKTYRDNGMEVHAVRGVDLTIGPGEFSAIVGPSGSGKTTLLNIISGLDSPTSGKVWLKGISLSEMSRRQLSDFRRDHIGFIFQAYNLIPVLTVRENVEYIMMLQGIDKEGTARPGPGHAGPGGPSGNGNPGTAQIIRRSAAAGGHRQGHGFTSPHLILADEPTANLDSETGSSLIDMMYALNQKTGMTFLFSTHDPMVMEKAKRVITLKDGQISEDIRKK